MLLSSAWQMPVVHVCTISLHVACLLCLVCAYLMHGDVASSVALGSCCEDPACVLADLGLFGIISSQRYGSVRLTAS